MYFLSNCLISSDRYGYSPATAIRILLSECEPRSAPIHGTNDR